MGMNRRGFLQKVGRGSLLAALMAAAGILVARRQVVSHQACSEGFRCRECRSLSQCQLPEAKTTREYGEEG